MTYPTREELDAVEWDDWEALKRIHDRMTARPRRLPVGENGHHDHDAPGYDIAACPGCLGGVARLAGIVPPSEIDLAYDDGLLAERNVKGIYRGIGKNGHHQIVLGSARTGADQLETWAHECVHAEQRERLGPEFDDLYAAELQAFGNQVEGPIETEARERAAQIMLELLGPDYTIVHVPTIHKARTVD